MGKDLAARLAAVLARRERVLSTFTAARRALALADDQIRILETRLNLGDGHVLTPDPDPAEFVWQRRSADCRLCAAPACSIAGKLPCPGDQHVCLAEIGQGVTSTAFQRYGHDAWLCGQPGQFGRGYRSWICSVGHRTDHRHDLCLPGCACRFLAGPRRERPRRSGGDRE